MRFASILLLIVVSVQSMAGTVRVESHPTRSVIFGSGPAAALSNPGGRYETRFYRAQYDWLTRLGFTPLTTAWGTRLYSDVHFLVKDDRLSPDFSRRFLQALETEKLNLMRIFYLSDEEYNRLALMAFGVAVQESQLGASVMYIVKEHAQLEVTLLKRFRAWREGRSYEGENSRGPTQIKSVPDKLKDYYRIDENSLTNPRCAAIATLAFLAQTYNEMLVRARDRHRFHFITPETIFDYTLYGYFGGLRRILRRAALPYDLDLNVLTDQQLDPIAIPEMNTYVLGVKRSIRWITVFERSPRLNYDLR